jgi:hypothetical protein
MAKRFERYKTEYRAYNYEGKKGKGYNKLSPTKVVTKYGFKWSERQLEVFEQIFGGYTHTKQYWDDSFESITWSNAHPGVEPDVPTGKGAYHDATISGTWKSSIEARRQALVDYVNPDDEGFNKYDSIRVDDLYRALDAIPLGTATTNGKPMSTLAWKAAGLKKAEAHYVLEESPDMRKKLRAHLADAAYVHIYDILCGIAGVKKATPIQDLGKSKTKTIQDFSEALDQVPVGTTDPKDKLVRALRFKTAKLSKADAKMVLEHNSKLLNKIELRLGGQALAELKQLLQDCRG